MRVWIDTDACTGCGLCADVCPSVFSMEDDIAVVVAAMVSDEDEDCVGEAVESCPVEAIGLDE
jgi:ferredoxin